MAEVAFAGRTAGDADREIEIHRKFEDGGSSGAHRFDRNVVAQDVHVVIEVAVDGAAVSAPVPLPFRPGEIRRAVARLLRDVGESARPGRHQ